MDTTVTLDEFRHRCDELVAAVAETGEALVVTRDGVPVVQVIPSDSASAKRPAEEKPSSAIGSMKGRIKIYGDIVGPILPEWDCQS